jgi:exopolysaccharide biosynthesis WecB/TagA/CpsF family protein
MDPRLPALEVLGVRVARLSAQEALGELERLHDESAPAVVAFVNAHTLNLASQQPSFRDVLGRAALVLNDGAGLALAARWQGSGFPENLNGTDFTPRVLRLAAARGWRVFLLGSRPGVAETAATALAEQIPGLAIAGTHHGYFGREEGAGVAERIHRSEASVLLVALGNPLQELWLDQYLARTGCQLGLGVGAFLDFVAGNVPRAPQWMRDAGVEWAFRLLQEPGRMWRRYVLGNPLFVARLVRERMRQGWFNPPRS